METKTTLKRTSEESQMNSNNESKHRKLDDPDQIKLLYETGKLNKLTVAVLSSFLNGNGISTSNLRKSLHNTIFYYTKYFSNMM